MSEANSLTRAVWSRKERLARNCWKGEAGALLGSEPPGSLQTWHEAEPPVGENSMWKWFKQQGVVYSLLTMRSCSLYPCALHRTVLQGAVRLPSVPLCMWLPFEVSWCEHSSWFVIHIKPSLKSGTKASLVLEPAQVQQVLRCVWVKSLCHWQGECILNPELLSPSS